MTMIMLGPADTANFFWTLWGNPATFYIIGTKKSGQTGKGTLALKVISMPGDVTSRVNSYMRGICSQQFRYFLDLFGWDITFFCGLIKGPLGDGLGKFIKTIGIIFYKVRIIFFVFDKVIHDGEHVGSIRPGFDLYPDIGLCG